MVQCQPSAPVLSLLPLHCTPDKSPTAPRPSGHTAAQETQNLCRTSVLKVPPEHGEALPGPRSAGRKQSCAGCPGQELHPDPLHPHPLQLPAGKPCMKGWGQPGSSWMGFRVLGGRQSSEQGLVGLQQPSAHTSPTAEGAETPSARGAREPGGTQGHTGRRILIFKRPHTVS